MKRFHHYFSFIVLCVLLFPAIGSAALSLDRLNEICDKEKTREKPLKLVPKFFDWYEKDGDARIPLYEFTVENGKPNGKYQLITYTLLGQKDEVKCTVAPDGTLMSEDLKHLQGLINYMEGEPAFLFLISDNKKRCCVAEVTPFPYEYSQNGCYQATIKNYHISAIFFMLAAEGFEPNESIVMLTRVSGVEREHSVQADPEGKLHTSMDITPDDGLKKSSAGIATITLIGKKGALVMEHPWGVEWLKSDKKRRKQNKA
jgi:hypothetical protein